MTHGTTKWDLHREVTQHIVDAIEAGAPRFEMPWHCSAATGQPLNARTGQLYRGINTVSLWASAQKRGFGSGFWASYRQWQDLDAQVRKGEKASLIVFYKELAREVRNEKTGEIAEETYRLARASRVFNADQVDGWESPPPLQRGEAVAIAHADAFVASTGADIRHGGERACYRWDEDWIHIPQREWFVGSSTSSPTESYYATLLHELTHWTGHESRLDRLLRLGRFGSATYAMEELVAELGAAFLCAELSITNAPRMDHAAFIESWIAVLKRDPKAIFTAAAKANEAVTFLGSFQQNQMPSDGAASTLESGEEAMP